MKSSTQKYYLVSDLHLGGDGALQHCDYTAEFIEFLKGLEKEDPDTELLIVGDTFGFWELTLVQGVEKLDHIVTAHQAIFDQLRATGERIKITMMVGNHDYDLACNAAFAARLRAYNIYLDKSLVLVRPVGDKKIWIEHGQQHDEFNAFPDYGNPYALPVGYFITGVLRQRGKPAFGLWPGKLAQGHSFGWHYADSGLDTVELLLPRDERSAALGAAAVPASRRSDNCGDRC
jgi:UDP-2,3-diacylglucosamine pyrophosphatase LpxH